METPLCLVPLGMMDVNTGCSCLYRAARIRHCPTLVDWLVVSNQQINKDVFHRRLGGRCDRNGSPRDRSPQYNICVLSTVMVRVSDIILHKGTLRLITHTDNSKRTRFYRGTKLLSHRPPAKYGAFVG
jgi:hypothetical protein